MITIFSSSSNYVDRLFLKGTTDYVPKITDWLQLQCWKAVPDTGAGGKSDRPTSRSINIKHILSTLHGCTMLQCQFLRYQAITATSYPIIFKRPQKHVLHLEHVYLSHILVSTTSSSSFGSLSFFYLHSIIYYYCLSFLKYVEIIFLCQTSFVCKWQERFFLSALFPVMTFRAPVCSDITRMAIRALSLFWYNL